MTEVRSQRASRESPGTDASEASTIDCRIGAKGLGFRKPDLAAELHFKLFGIISSLIELKVKSFFADELSN